MTHGHQLLNQYLDAKGVTDKDFAADVGVSRSLVTLWRLGQRTPGGWRAQDIERATKRKVPAKAWRQSVDD